MCTVVERRSDATRVLLRQLSSSPEGITVRVAETLEELKAAARLVYREYLRRRYIAPHPAELQLCLFHALPETTTFIAVDRQQRIVGTVALIPDSPLGLPMDEVYQTEIDGVRAQGLGVAELSMLAFDTTALRHHKRLCTLQTSQVSFAMQLFKCMFDYVRSCTAIDELVACFHPRHAFLYDLLRLQPLGGVRPYRRLSSRPAIARHLNVAQTAQFVAADALMDFFYTPKYPLVTFSKKLRLRSTHLQELFMDRPDILMSADPSIQSYVEQCYSAAHDEAVTLPAPSLAVPSLAEAPAI